MSTEPKVPNVSPTTISKKNGKTREAAESKK